MIEVKKFIGSFTGSVYSHYTHKDLNIYQLIFDCIFNRQKTDKASLFYEKIDDFAYAGAHERFNKSGALVCGILGLCWLIGNVALTTFVK